MSQNSNHPAHLAQSWASNADAWAAAVRGGVIESRWVAVWVAVWVAQWPPARLPLAVEGSCWGRQSPFLKRGQPLLVAEVFLPTLIRRHQATTG